MEVVKKLNTKLLISCIVFMLLVTSSILAQENYRIIGKSLVELRQEKLEMSTNYQLKNKLSLIRLKDQAPISPIISSSTLRNYQAPKAYKYQDLAFFCRMEVKMDKAAKIPVRFRLGSVDYVNRLEGKY